MEAHSIASEKRITEIMRDDPLYQSKGFKGVGRILSGEERQRDFPYAPHITLDIEGPRILTQAYKETEGDPMVIRRGKAMVKLLNERTITISHNTRIVGNFASKPAALMTHPDQFYRWLDKEIDKGYRKLLSDEERMELHEIHRYWSNKAVHGMERNLLPENVKPYWFYNNQGAIAWVHYAHTGVPNHEKVFKVGVNGIIKQAKDRLKEIDSDPDIYLNARDFIEQKRFLQAVIISLEALVNFGKRFAEKARKMAKEEVDQRRKEELEEIAEICDWVPGNPPRTLHEALQCYWFVTLPTRLLDLQTSGLGDRFDQLMYPFYERDMKEGRIDRLQAQELVEHLFLRMNEEGQLVPPAQGASGGIFNVRMLTIGGQTRKGKDATNEMSYIVLDAVKSIALLQPQIAVRLHKKTPTEFIYKIIETMRTRSGNFSFFNDEMKIPYLRSIAIPLEDARNYATDGCVRWIIPGKALGSRSLEGVLILPKCLEYALSQGVHKFTGEQMGYPTPDPVTFKSIEDVYDAFFEQVRFFTEKLVLISKTVDVLEEELLPQPLLSAFLDGCIENGQDCRKYKYYGNKVIPPVGQVTVFNSLAAIKKLVFDEKTVSIAELVDAMKSNWEGKEELRQLCIQAPKFGNDDDEVDAIAHDIQNGITKVIRSFKSIWGTDYMEDGTGGSSYYNWSGLTGATPDGRKDRDLFNDGTISPCIGTDKKGPTAVLNSVGKIDHAGTFTHLLNQKITPLYMNDDNKDKFAAYLRTFVDLGIHHIQFNNFDREALLDAQKHPQNYPNLVVKVAGYSSYYVDLGKEVQDQIIERSEQMLG